MDFINDFLRYTNNMESPQIYRRWCAIAACGALLGRRYYLQHGHFRKFPNTFVILIGSSGSRKSTPIKLIKKLMLDAGWDKFAADKTRKEKFLMDLGGHEEVELKNGKPVYDSTTAENLWGSDGNTDPKEVFIAADEFNEFVPAGDIDFYSQLGSLWDWDNEKTPFTHRLKNSHPVTIYQPTISLLGGITPENFSYAFPTSIIGQGFLARTLFIHGPKTPLKIAFPSEPSKDQTNNFLKDVQTLAVQYGGALTLDPKAIALLTLIYERWQPIDDVRFESYSTRRFDYLLKLCIIILASKGLEQITDECIIEANTVLSAAEANMPKALGEFGKGKNSAVAQKILDVLATASKPMMATEIWKQVRRDLDRTINLAEILSGLTLAQKIQLVSGKGYLPNISPMKSVDYVDWSLLSEQERDML